MLESAKFKAESKPMRQYITINFSISKNFLLYLALVFPHALNGTYNEYFVGLKLAVFLLFFVLSGVIFTVSDLIIVFIILFIGLINSFSGDPQYFSVTRFFVYCVFLFIFCCKIDEKVTVHGVFRWYLYTVLVLAAISLLSPGILDYFYGWNSYEQQLKFQLAEQRLIIFGLPTTAAFSFAMIIFAIYILREHFPYGFYLLFAIFAYFISTLVTTASFVAISIIFLFILYTKLRPYVFIGVVILLCLAAYWAFLSDTFLTNYVHLSRVSIVNRLSEDSIYSKNLDNLVSGVGFTVDPSFAFGDMGYLDNFARIGLAGTLLYYYLFGKFLLRNLHTVNGFWLIILFVLILEAGHTYSKSAVFLPILTLCLLLLRGNGRINKIQASEP